MVYLTDYLNKSLERAASYWNSCSTKARSAVLLVCVVRREEESLDMYVCLCVLSGVGCMHLSTLPCKSYGDIWCIDDTSFQSKSYPKSQ